MGGENEVRGLARRALKDDYQRKRGSGLSQRQREQLDSAVDMMIARDPTLLDKAEYELRKRTGL